ETLIESLRIQFQVYGALLQIRHAEFALIPKHRVMEFPELLLLIGAKRRFGGLLSMGMDVRQWELAVHNAHLLGIILFHLLQGRKQSAAVRTFKIGELDDRYRCSRRTSGWKTGSGDLSSKRFEVGLESEIFLQSREQHV